VTQTATTNISRISESDAILTPAQLIPVLQRSLYPGASSESVALVIDYCAAAKLDPMQKPVHIVPMWDSKTSSMRDVIMPGIGLYRIQAARTNEYAGVTEPEYGPDINETIGGADITYPAWCKVTVLRRLPDGTLANFTAVERWKENYAMKGGKEKSIAPNAMWSKRPYGQLAKCAEAQALRKAFPEVGQAPTAEEMEGKSLDAQSIEGEVVRQAEARSTQVEQLPEYSDEQFKTNLPKWLILIGEKKKTADDIIAMVSSKYRLTDAQINQIKQEQQS